MKSRNTLMLALLLAAAGPRLQAQTSETHSFASVNKAVPDGSPSGVADVRTVSSPIVNLSKVRVKLRIDGEFNGDLYGYLRHTTSTTTNIAVLLNRAGRTAGDSAGYDDAGFNVTFDDAAENGDVHVYRNVSTVPAGSPLTGTWRPDGRNVDPGVVNDAVPRTATLAGFNGQDASGEWALFLSDLESGGTNMLVSWELDLDGAQRPVVTWAAPADIVYGTALGSSQLNADASVPGTFAYTPAVGAVLHAGSGQTLSVTFTPTDSAGYVSVTTSVTLTVATAPLVITANSTTKVYGAALPPFTASYSGFVNGDTEAVLDTPVSLATTATPASAAGSYPISASEAADGDYSVTFVAGTLTVTPAPLVITADSATKVYGAALPAFSAGYSGFVNGDGPGCLSPAVTFTTPASASSPAGLYQVTPGSAANPNYAITFESGNLTISPAALTIAAADKTKLFGQELPAFTATYSGFVNGDSAAGLTSPVTFSTTASAASPAGTYPITPAGAASPNYTIAYANGLLTIDAANTLAGVSSSVNPSLPGQAVAFTFTVSALAPGAGTPTGSAVFKFDGEGAGTSVPLSDGAATLSRSDLTHTTHTLTVDYAGDGNFTGSSATLSPVQNVNTPPVAGPDTIQRWATNGVKVSLATLLSNDTDADGDPITFVTVTNLSPHGATVERRGNWIYYTPAEGFTEADSFSYIISDGHGATVAGTVTVAIKVDNVPSPNLVLTHLDGTSYRVRLSGIPNKTYRLQYSDGLEPASWQPMTTITTDAFGYGEYTDTNGAAQRYYRSVHP
jgi:subtilisin-like proprotein convertase family protein